MVLSGGRDRMLPLALLFSTMLRTSFPTSQMDRANMASSQDAVRGAASRNVHCSEYSNQVLPDGQCHIIASLPRPDEQSCRDVFRCTDEASYWLHENEERKQQVLALKETISELQEELRNHRHRLKVVELQSEQKELSLHQEQRLRKLERRSMESHALVRLHGSLAHDAQMRLHNMSAMVERLHRSPGCGTNVVHAGPFLSTWETLRPEVQHVNRCPIDCASIYSNGFHRSGVYTVVPGIGAMPVQVFCDMDTEGGGWTMIQRRQDGSVSFNRNWKEYKEGFGDLQGEFWLGNEHIHHLTRQGRYTLRIDLEDWSNKHGHATYDNFSIEEESNQYRLHVARFSGTVEDSFGWYHNLHGFSTPDTDNICAGISRGGWWYHQCFFANLNGVYYKGGHYSPRRKSPLGPDGIVWFTWKNSDYYSLKKVSMMLRPCKFQERLSP